MPFHREEYCGKIVAYFNLDLALIRGFSLGESAERLLIVVALFKIQRFLRDGLRLRTACDLELDGDGDALVVTRPQGFTPPTLFEIESELPKLIREAASAFGKPTRTIVKIRGISECRSSICIFQRADCTRHPGDGMSTKAPLSGRRRLGECFGR